MEIKELKKYLNRDVTYKGIKDVYMLTACVLRKNENRYYYQAEIKDKNANSLIICKIDDIEGA